MKAKEKLMAHLSGEIGIIEKTRLMAHMIFCSSCSEERVALDKIWKELGDLPEALPPINLRATTLARIEAMVHEEEPLANLDSAHWLLKLLGAIIGAVSMAFLSLWVLRGVTSMEQLSSEIIFLCAAVWTGVTGLSFLFAIGAVPSLTPTWQGPARIALVGFGLALGGIALCPKMSLVEWWETLAPGEFLLHYGSSISHAAFGAVYAFIPFLLAVCLFGARLKGNFFSQLFAAAVLYFVLLVPGIFLQAMPLSALVFFSWTVGSALGVTIAALGSAGLVRLASSGLPSRA